MTQPLPTIKKSEAAEYFTILTEYRNQIQLSLRKIILKTKQLR